MGVEHMSEIVYQLITHGRSSDTPVAVIREGTTENQFVVTGRLADIVEKAQGIRPPAILIVGEVVNLREQVDWFVPQVSSLSMTNTQTELISA
jgi:uroporphyrinogen III methyltransferase/synthase